MQQLTEAQLSIVETPLIWDKVCDAVATVNPYALMRVNRAMRDLVKERVRIAVKTTRGAMETVMAERPLLAQVESIDIQVGHRVTPAGIDLRVDVVAKVGLLTDGDTSDDDDDHDGGTRATLAPNPTSTPSMSIDVAADHLSTVAVHLDVTCGTITSENPMASLLGNHSHPYVRTLQLHDGIGWSDEWEDLISGPAATTLFHVLPNLETLYIPDMIMSADTMAALVSGLPHLTTVMPHLRYEDAEHAVGAADALEAACAAASPRQLTFRARYLDLFDIAKIPATARLALEDFAILEFACHPHQYMSSIPYSLTDPPEKASMRAALHTHIASDVGRIDNIGSPDLAVRIHAPCTLWRDLLPVLGPRLHGTLVLYNEDFAALEVVRPFLECVRDNAPGLRRLELNLSPAWKRNVSQEQLRDAIRDVWPEIDVEVV